ncbi:nose resistant to fluoxetine protein 6-like [Pollicipes pollicipes]|uniref:nose resistant to fluoxetine protein 6-like n=1 Tax=Pollicipes pollicipes TaxID=41117 RepID=UPI0018852090|nr:nose resistant to fluoxetine protein 6-like [Pollicipes pollicipes]
MWASVVSLGALVLALAPPVIADGGPRPLPFGLVRESHSGVSLPDLDGVLTVLANTLEVKTAESGASRVVSRLHVATAESEDPLCRNHTQILWDSIPNELWAIAMLDASGKLPDGILMGNIHAFGSYDECLAVEVRLNASRHPELPERGLHFRGRYAMTVVSPPAARGGQAEGRERGAGGLGGPVLVPTSLGVQLWAGLCIPSSCSAADLQAGLAGRLGGNFSVAVPSTETAADAVALTPGDVVVITVCGLVAVLMAVGTGVDLLLREQARRRARRAERVAVDGKDGDGSVPPGGDVQDPAKAHQARPSPPAKGLQVLVAFSVYTNGMRILGTTHAKGTLTCLHGMRFFSMTWVLTGHVFGMYLGYAQNGLMFLDWAKNPAFSVVLNAYPSVDTFFLLSGLLLAYVFCGRYERHKRFNLPMFYLHRYLRLTPPYAIMLAISATWFVHLMHGPIWHAWIDPQVDTCRHYWWRHLLYIQNYFDASEECLPQTWYLSNDMQLFVLSPLVLLPLVWRPLAGALWLLVAIAALMAARIAVWCVQDLPPDRMVLRPEHAQQLGDIYVAIWARAPVWLLGVALGFALHRLRGRRVRMRAWQWSLGWAAAIATGLSVEYGMWGYQLPWESYSRPVALAFGTLHRLAWGLAVSWVVFACVTGYGGFVNTFLSYPAFLPLSRLTYCCYLVHISVLEASTLSSKGTVYFDGLRLLYLILDVGRG